MKEIVCPNCHTTFQVDDTTYASILSQVRDKAFSDELKSRMDAIEKSAKAQSESALLKAQGEWERELSAKERELAELKMQYERASDTIASYEKQKATELTALTSEKQAEKVMALAEKDREIAELTTRLGRLGQEHEIAMLKQQAEGQAEIEKKEREIIGLQNNLKSAISTAKESETQLKEEHKRQIADREAEIERLRNFKMRLATKLVGESLEQHCANLFEQAQCNGQFRNAQFGKDNTVVDGTKGDFIFRDYIDDEEYVSIMFEMKNESDESSTHHRNDEFLEKLDRDRRNKKCEYAVLVSMLEQDNEIYNAGIVDKSHRYEKMLVIRPQFFIPVIRVISESARKGYNERRALVKELAEARTMSYDLSNFEQRLENVCTTYNNYHDQAHKKIEAAVNGLDKAIEGLERQLQTLRDIRQKFETSDTKMQRGLTYLEQHLTAKHLTYGNPTVKKMIDDGKDDKKRD